MNASLLNRPTYVAVNHTKLVNRCLRTLRALGYKGMKFYVNPSHADLVFRRQHNWTIKGGKDTCFFISVYPKNSYAWVDKHYGKFDTVLMKRSRKSPSVKDFAHNLDAWINCRSVGTLILVCPGDSSNIGRLREAGWNIEVWDFEKYLDRYPGCATHSLDKIFCSFGLIEQLPEQHTMTLRNDSLSQLDIAINLAGGVYSVNWTADGGCRVRCFDEYTKIMLQSMTCLLD